MKPNVAAICGLGMLFLAGGLTGCGEDSVVAAANGPPARPLQTGQTTCYDASGNTIPCAGTGQDGELQAGAARRYTDNGDGTITDASTGLMWEKKSGDGSIHDTGNTYNWSDAFSVFIAGLNADAFAGHTDWRLPNVNELQSIATYVPSELAIDVAFNTRCFGIPGTVCSVATCSCTQYGFYFSSTTDPADPANALGVNFFGPGTNTITKTASFSIRAVRGGL